MDIMRAMTLTEYLADQKMTQEDFASLAGVSQSTVARWCSGVLPRRRYRGLISRLTGGKVTAASLLVEEEAA